MSNSSDLDRKIKLTENFLVDIQPHVDKIKEGPVKNMVKKLIEVIILLLEELILIKKSNKNNNLN